MKKELFIHFAFWFSFFVFITLTHKYFNLSYWPFWVGGMVGTLLPDLDHFIYIFFIKPQDLTSQRVNYLLDKRELIRSIELIYETRNERSGLIFHSIFFQIIFFILTFWMLSSSGSMFGRGLVLAFSFHLIIDQLVDLKETGNLDNWLKYLAIQLDLNQSRIYLAVSLIAVCIVGFLM